MFRVITEGADYREHVLLKDGQGVLLRPGTPEDLPAVRKLFKATSSDSLRMRFMASVSEVPESTLHDMCGGDFSERGCLLVIIGEDEDMRVAGIGNYIGLGNGKTAEVAFLVADEYQGRGISTLLLERLAGLAAAHGYVEFEADVLFENQAMMSVFKSSGFEIHRGVEDGVVHVELPVRGAVALHERGELRERIAVANSLAPLLRPRTVAVVGASRDPANIGNLIFRHILHAPFQGTVYPINLEAESVHGVRAYPALDQLPEAVDLAVVAVPANNVLGVAEEAVRAGAKGLVVVSAGFAEAGEEGRERERRLVELVRAHGVRLIGPNCLGVITTDPGVHLNASLAPSIPPLGRVGFFSHSGGLGLVILEHAARRGIGFSTFVSAGNRADVSGNDLLQYWEEDPATDLALLYLETFGNPRRFVRIARRFTRRKPILCVKSARSAAGQHSAVGRSKGTFGSESEVEALFHQAGLIRAETLDELFDVAVLLAHQPLPRGNRVTIISNSRGVATLLADACAANDLDLSGPGIVDLGPMATPQQYQQTVREALEHDQVDALLVTFACVGECEGEPIARAIRQGYVAATEATGVGKPTLLCLMGFEGALGATPPEGMSEEPEGPVFPLFLFPESAPRALAKVVRYATFQQRKLGKLVWYEDVDAASARHQVAASLKQTPDETGLVWVEGEAAASLLTHFGIAVGNAPEEPGLEIALAIRSNPFFGPIIELTGPERDPVVRITPLTDEDVEDAVSNAGVPSAYCAHELLARISQLIEELPWIAAMRAGIAPPPAGGPSCALMTSVRIGFVPSPTAASQEKP
jgi:acetate---CoA ligase (ADP-forming)